MNNTTEAIAWTDLQLDVGGMEPPEPMVRILEALDLLAPNERLCVLIDREPHPLYRVLEKYGFSHSIAMRDDFRYQLTIWEPQPSGKARPSSLA